MLENTKLDLLVMDMFLIPGQNLCTAEFEPGNAWVTQRQRKIATKSAGRAAGREI